MSSWLICEVCTRFAIWIDFRHARSDIQYLRSFTTRSTRCYMIKFVCTLESWNPKNSISDWLHISISDFNFSNLMNLVCIAKFANSFAILKDYRHTRSAMTWLEFWIPRSFCHDPRPFTKLIVETTLLKTVEMPSCWKQIVSTHCEVLNLCHQKKYIFTIQLIKHAITFKNWKTF